VTGGTIDFLRIERAVREILIAVGENPDREGLLETARCASLPVDAILVVTFKMPLMS